MLRRSREPFGKAGLIVAIVALVAALGGGAYAAKSALTGKQKKEVEKIAKNVAGAPGAKGAQGAAGSNGANGTNGEKGENGEKGAKGDRGAKGEPGEIANVVNLAPHNGEGHCEQGGGVKVYNETGEGFACNGEGGGGGGGGEGYPDTLPEGKTETGYYEFLGQNGVALEPFIVSTISFPLRLASAPEIVYFSAASHTPEEEEKCPAEFAAKPGVLCIYRGAGGPEPERFVQKLPSAIGALFLIENTAEHPAESGFGTWAVTAPEAP
jgi:hypothetical protein